MAFHVFIFSRLRSPVTPIALRRYNIHLHGALRYWIGPTPHDNFHVVTCGNFVFRLNWPLSSSRSMTYAMAGRHFGSTYL